MVWNKVFTLAKPPQQTISLNKLEPLLRLELLLDDVLIPQLKDNAQSIVFQNGAGKTLYTYNKLHVFDATGKTITAHFELPKNIPQTNSSKENTKTHPLKFHIVVDDQYATYPLTIDPLIATPMAKFDRVSADDSDAFGSSTAIDGDYHGNWCTLG